MSNEELNGKLNELLNTGRKERTAEWGIRTAAAVTCADGYRVSIQCSATSYCTPREDLADVAEYVSFELGFPNEHDDIIEEYAEMENDQVNTVFPYVPRSAVLDLLENHGGIKDGDN